jgi:hypothetical protein
MSKVAGVGVMTVKMEEMNPTFRAGVSMDQMWFKAYSVLHLHVRGSGALKMTKVLATSLSSILSSHCTEQKLWKEA